VVIYTDRKENKISLDIRKFRGIGCKVIFAHFLVYERKPFLIYDCAPDPILISLYMRKVFFPFLSVYLKEKSRTFSHIEESHFI
jgi:hypothetical protein